MNSVTNSFLREKKTYDFDFDFDLFGKGINVFSVVNVVLFFSLSI